MATTIIIPDIDYETYNALSEEFFTKMPYAILNDKYLGSQNKAIFQFHDQRYIPVFLRIFQLEPPLPKDFEASKFDFLYDKKGEDEDANGISLKDEFRSKAIAGTGTVDLSSSFTEDSSSASYQGPTSKNQ